MVPDRDLALVGTLFQPIVDIATGRVVAHEALSRFADGTGAVAPDVALQQAYRTGTIEDVDGACIGQAVTASEVMVGRGAHDLFVNVEPPTLWRDELPFGLTCGLPLTVEITERALGRDTGRLLGAIRRLRDLGHAIAVDDLGAEPATLALLPLIAPDIIKLDMGLIRQQPDQNVARIMTAVADYTAHTDTYVLAKGIENERHEIMAQALGATLGQGWHYGRPEPATVAAQAENSVEARRDFRARVARSASAARPAARTPFEIVSATLASRRAGRALLVQVSMFLEERARAGGDSAVVLTTFQHDSNVTPATAERYQRLTDSGCLVTVFTVGAASRLPAEAHGVVIAPDDPLAAEWDVIVLTADFAAALTARELDPSRHDAGQYDFVLTTDRALVTQSARALLAHGRRA